uniref:Uncharacterized protein n=1 Tax=Arundo donax TaxID=35708 RepID=A0A0A9A130_ARUDO
MLVVMGLQT